MMNLQKGHALVLIAPTKSGKSFALEAAASMYADRDVLYLDGERTREGIGIPVSSSVRVKCVSVPSTLSDVLDGESFDVLVIDCLDRLQGGDVLHASEIAQRYDCIVIAAKSAPRYVGGVCSAGGVASVQVDAL